MKNKNTKIKIDNLHSSDAILWVRGRKHSSFYPFNNFQVLLPPLPYYVWFLFYHETPLTNIPRLTIFATTCFLCRSHIVPMKLCGVADMLRDKAMRSTRSSVPDIVVPISLTNNSISKGIGLCDPLVICAAMSTHMKDAVAKLASRVAAYSNTGADNPTAYRVGGGDFIVMWIAVLSKWDHTTTHTIGNCELSFVQGILSIGCTPRMHSISTLGWLESCVLCPTVTWSTSPFQTMFNGETLRSNINNLSYRIHTIEAPAIFCRSPRGI